MILDCQFAKAHAAKMNQKQRLNNVLFRFIAVLFIVTFSAYSESLRAQSVSREPDQTWVGQRIIMLRGWGEVHHHENDRPRTAVGINIVTPVVRIEGNRLWLSSTGGDD